MTLRFICVFFFFNDTATTEIYTLSLHDALPIWAWATTSPSECPAQPSAILLQILFRSEERFSRNAETDIVCRLLLEKKKVEDATRGMMSHPARRRPSESPISDTPSSVDGQEWRTSDSVMAAVLFFVPFFFFLNDTAPPEIYPLPLPDALPI